ncbi:BQ2448_3291 [Microbotryum intermedium]|uniref:BQ2448_3291 protein n=1 Tax=Microbotryum intermedium TaxID=269621 RepID=A0A238FI71_9BASI|nr:BQ2448_3291 [Microbotryum intermedium]
MASDSNAPAPPVRRSASGHPTSPPAAGLLDLPSPLLERVLASALRIELASQSHGGLEGQRSLARTLLYDLGNRTLAHHTKKVLWSTVTLPDDDALVVRAEMARAQADSGIESSKLATTSHDPSIKSLSTLYTDATVAQLVRHLHLTEAECLTSGTAESPVISGSSNSSPQSSSAPLANNHRHRDTSNDEDCSLRIQPIQDDALLQLVSKLTSLSSFEWASSRHPPRMLCSTLGASSRSLTSFTFDLVEACDAREQTYSSTSVTISPSRALSTSAINFSAGRIQRWDAPELSALPLSLTHLTLSYLSQTGAQELASALPSLPALENLELGKSVYVDDPLLAEVGKHVARLKRLRLYNLPGSKLTEVGLGDVLDGCSALESLELYCVEGEHLVLAQSPHCDKESELKVRGPTGRLSKSTWSKVSPLPESLKTLSLIYHELPSPPHKSWVLDHLNSLAMALEFSSLQSLIISRKVEDVVRIPGQHWTSMHPIDPVLAPRPLPTAFVDAIASRGRSWKCLNLDLWQIDGHALKKVLSACTNLTTLQVMYDESLKNLLGLSSAFAVAHQLRHFVVSIDPAHAPELAVALSPGHPLSPSQSPTSTVCALPFGSPTDTQVTPPRAHHGRRSSASSTASKSSLLPDHLSSVAPSTKDWRRFLKKTLALESVEWTGRGGFGTWFFERTSTLSSSIKVDFEPSGFYHKANAAEGGDLLVGLEGLDPALRALSWRRRPSEDASPATESYHTVNDKLALSDPLPTLDEGSGAFSTLAKRSLGASITDIGLVSHRRSSTPPIGTWTSRSHIGQQQQHWSSSTVACPSTRPSGSPPGRGSRSIESSSDVAAAIERLGMGATSTVDVDPSTSQRSPKWSWSEFVTRSHVKAVHPGETMTKVEQKSTPRKGKETIAPPSIPVAPTPTPAPASPSPSPAPCPAPAPIAPKTFSSIVGGGGPTKVINTRTSSGTGPRGNPRTTPGGGGSFRRLPHPSGGSSGSGGDATHSHSK